MTFLQIMRLQCLLTLSIFLTNFPLCRALYSRKEALLALQPDTLMSIARTRQDADDSLWWYEHAARLNHVPAMVAAAAGYLQIVPPTDNTTMKGYRWYVKAAEKGNEIAQYELAQLFRGLGNVVKKNSTKARFLLQEASKSERHLGAMFVLASEIETEETQT